MKTWHIHIKGQVQGIGFRPFIFRLAQMEKLKGWVNNSTDGVHIEFNANEKDAHSFLQKILKQAPLLSKITNCKIQPVSEVKFEDFQILESRQGENANLLLTPDFTTCLTCKAEIYNASNQRYFYPFITCTECGPRYSIIQKLPYDRALTTMHSFEMCVNCYKEYQNPIDRRYFSQTNSCPTCSIEISLVDNNKITISKNVNEVIERVIQLWKEGKIIAIKGIGGYVLTCDVTNEKAIQKLRQLKHRPSKPFALMYPSLEQLKKEVEISKEEVDVIEDVCAPIVLFQIKNKNTSKLPFQAIAPNLQQIGVMLPYTPLFELLLKKMNQPIIATSGNISNSPIIFEDKKALENLSTIADFILTNNREIVVPQDDSVIRFSFFKKQKIIIRRSRGIAPSYINTKIRLPNSTIFATGGMLKSTFTFLHQGNIFISQYFGDLEHFETEQSYRHTANHFFNLFQSHPELILCDSHPDYPSTHFANELSQSLKLPFHKIQHHKAHFAAILGEHNLMESKDDILGVIWDGTGYGDDGQIWGGEFFSYKNFEFEREAYFEYFDLILGNKMAREPRISALSLCKNLPEAKSLLKKKFKNEEWNIYNKILARDNNLKTSSIGRLFDGVASLLGICDLQSFEGEAAMQIENLAMEYFKKNGLDIQESYYDEMLCNHNIIKKGFIQKLLQDIQAGKAANLISAKFHLTLVKIIDANASRFNIKKIAFSGGVFQNSVLVDLLLHHLGEKYELFFHQDLSPNDENISFGQLIYHKIQQDSANK